MLRALGHDFLGEERFVRLLCAKHLPDAHAQHFPALAEDGLHQPAEKALVATQVGHVIACHADDRTFHLWRRIKHALVYGEEVLHIVPRLYEHREDAIYLAAGCSCHAQGHLALDHPRTTGYEVLVVKHLEEYLGRDIVRIIARKDKRLPVEDGCKIHAEEVFADDIVLQFGETLVQIRHRLPVYLHSLHGARLLHQVLGKHAHPRPYLEHRNVRTGIHSVGYALGYIEICKEMLPQMLLWLDLSHWIIIGLCRKITNKNRDQAHETRIFAFFSLSKRGREHPFPSSPSYDILHDRISHSSSQKGK